MNELRYIIFLIDSKFKQHDGKVFCSLPDAREFTKDIIKERYADKIIIGQFVIDPNSKEMMISLIETFGFKNDKKTMLQLEIFNSTIV